MTAFGREDGGAAVKRSGAKTIRALEILVAGAVVAPVLLVLVGIVFTYARARTHTVVASYLLHVSYNSCLFLGFLVASHGFRHFPAAP